MRSTTVVISWIASTNLLLINRLTVGPQGFEPWTKGL